MSRSFAPDDEPVVGRSNRQGRGSRLWWILGLIVFAFIVIPSVLAEMITDWMWFGSQGLADVYTTRLWLGLGVFVVGTLLAAFFLWVNWAIAARVNYARVLYPGQEEVVPRGLVHGIIAVVAVVVGFFMGLTVADEWPTILLFLNGVPFGQADPLFNNDIGFYVFGLPFYRLLRGWFIALVVLSAIGAAVIYLIGVFPSINRQLERAQRGRGRRDDDAPDFKLDLDRRISLHGSVLGALFLLLIAVGYWLDRFDLLYSSRAVAYGAGYADVNARLPALNILMVVAAITAVLLLLNVRMRTWKLMLGALGLWLVALVLVGGLYPYVVQTFVVKPNEFALEQPYIEYNIAATRRAFGLDRFREREVPVVESVTLQEIRQNPNTIENIRLWDYRPLLDTYSQLQAIRQYYTFSDVDIDRYVIDGRLRQVMLSARELSTSRLSEQQRNWQNTRLVYTHGYGAVVSPVNEVVGEGLPNLMVKNIPPETDVSELRMTRPEIYFGERMEEYVFVKSTQPEFDYPLGDTNRYTTYEGTGGVEMSNFFTKLLFAIRFGDGNILLTDYITPETRVLFHRQIDNMVNLLAPFLMYDGDPYVTIVDGKLYWIQDAYTYTDRYPYSSPHIHQDEDRNTYRINYIRNSVKVVIDAYEGNAVFYVADGEDPLVRAYRGIFPALFRDMSEMPPGVRAHIRYPEDLMNIQAAMYSIFHMTDPQVFFTKEDVWNVPFGVQGEGSEPLEAYYVNMQLPGEEKEGFMLILPFTPATRDNMIAWMAAKCDGEDYGEVEVIRYPKQQLIYGPRQIDARINQDPLISQQITLWSQRGSSVRRGNLLTIPIANSVLYVQPMFLQATNSRFPELKRVIVATGNSVGIGNDLQDALNVAFKIKPGEVVDVGDTGVTPEPGATPTVPVGAESPTPRPTATGFVPSTGSAAELTQSALAHYERAQEALRNGDLATYQREVDAMKADLDALALLVGAPPPTIMPVGTPVP